MATQYHSNRISPLTEKEEKASASYFHLPPFFPLSLLLLFYFGCCLELQLSLLPYSGKEGFDRVKERDPYSSLKFTPPSTATPYLSLCVSCLFSRSVLSLSLAATIGQDHSLASLLWSCTRSIVLTEPVGFVSVSTHEHIALLLFLYFFLPFFFTYHHKKKSKKMGRCLTLISCLVACVLLVPALPVERRQAQTQQWVLNSQADATARIETPNSQHFDVDIHRFAHLLSTHLWFDHLETTFGHLSKQISRRFHDWVRIDTQPLVVANPPDNDDACSPVDLQILKGQIKGAVGGMTFFFSFALKRPIVHGRSQQNR